MPAPSWVSSLPAINASLNGLAFLLLLTGFVLIKRGYQEAHRRAMLAAFATSVLFLACYLLYHFMIQGPKKFTGTGTIPTVPAVYYVILVTHVVLAAMVPVLAIVTIRRALKQDWERHRRIARITFPIWVYVSLTGVMIYLMLY